MNFLAADYEPRLVHVDRHGDRPGERRGFSLVEIMVATAISLLVMGATVALFGLVSERTTSARGGIDLSVRLRAAVERLRRDLSGHTVTTTPWQAPSQGDGYLEIDKSLPLSGGQDKQGLYGYVNDVLTFTTRAKDAPFQARATKNGVTKIMESQYAEVQWFVAQPRDSHGGIQANAAADPKTYNLYRHMLLVRPDLGTIPFNDLASAVFNDDGSSSIILNTDASIHYDYNSGSYIANSLSDLTYRDFRFNHNGAFYPFLFDSGYPGPLPEGSANFRYGEDVVLSDVLSFDVKLWDPLAEVKQDGSGRSLVPSDPGYGSGTSMSPQVFGAYVDLNYANAPNASYFSGAYYGAGRKSNLVNPNGPWTYDTWANGYEYYNGSPFSTNVTYGKTANATNGFAVNGTTGVGDSTTRSTSPPYPVPLRGLQIKVRTWDRGTRQVREATITESFVPD